ncbi:hypothetical protein RHGRI_024993 [Rhododendron griersonianum]|uniref:Uncharacterized protein n=1 Tax=Rhododendron griersonianum TaxID=479676 RepID=A0AAV6JBM1_9ERIC|nr:hypothetical protein RHGRI_024993 [Rhododendron griersonianum]
MASEETAEESALKNQKHEAHQVGNGTNSVITHNSVMPKEDKVMSKEIGHATKVASGPGSPSGLKIVKATPRKSSSSIKQNNVSKLQDGASPIWTKDLSFVYGYEKNTDVLGHSEAIKDQSNGRADKTHELESLNGIPVEIVELLVKNRHERRRLEAENAKENTLCMSKKTKNVTDSEIFEFSGFREKEMLRYPLGNKMLKPQSNGVGSMSAAGRSVCSTSCHNRRIVSSPTQVRGAHHVSMPYVADCPFRIEDSQRSATLSRTPNWNINLETFQKINEEQPCACTNKRIGNLPNPICQLELCSNETLPARQLLKLMDAGMSTKVSRKVDKNMEFANQPSFPHISHHSGIFSLNGVTRGNLPNSSGQIRDSSADHRGGRSSEYFTLVPISDAFAFPSKRDKNCVGRNHILGQVSQKMVNDRLKSKGMKRRKHSDYPTAVQNAVGGKKELLCYIVSEEISGLVLSAWSDVKQTCEWQSIKER